MEANGGLPKGGMACTLITPDEIHGIAVSLKRKRHSGRVRSSGQGLNSTGPWKTTRIGKLIPTERTTGLIFGHPG
ncbi:MAG: hypothetical protein VX438_19455, partial [Planctomycetota bacterium]|nr:hypothetical protein [Planctomycetota bacterium]